MTDNGSQDDVSAELDRLAFGPGDPAADDAVPRLAATPSEAVRRTIPPPRVTPPVALYGGGPGWKKRRRRGRRLLSLLFVLGLVGGGLFVARQYMLDKVVWDRDVAERADAVASAMGLAFTADVPVVELPFDEFTTESSARLAQDDAEVRRTLAGEWRSLGLLTGQLDLPAMAAAAAVETPAYYDPAANRIVIIEELPAALRSFALDRALGALLVDQHRPWSDSLDEQPWSVQVGSRAWAEAIALETAQSLLEPDARSVVLEQMLRLAVDEGVAASPSPYATTLLGRLGVAAFPVVGWARDAADWADGTGDGSWLEPVTPVGPVADAQVLDATRLLGGRTESPGDDSRGMLFWYHVLASRLDDDEAWRTAALWRDDRVEVRDSGSVLCVAAEFSVSNRDLRAAEKAFGRWAAAAPADSLTMVTATEVTIDFGVVTVDACDPGVAVATTDGSPVLALGAAPLRAEQFRRILAADNSRLPEAVACQVWSAGDSVSSADERGVLDGPDGWAAVDAHGDPTQISLGSC